METIAVFQGLRHIGSTPWKDMLSIPAVHARVLEAQKIIDAEHIEIEGYPLNLVDYCIHGPPPLFSHTATAFEHPLIFTVTIALWEAEGKPGDAVIGFSMGEWPVAVAAECLTFEEGLLAVVERGILTSQAGGASLLLRGELKIRPLQRLSAFTKGAWLSNINSLNQGIFSGYPERIEEVRKRLEAKTNGYGRLTVRPIDIGGAFHTPLMKPARRNFERFLRENGITFRKPRIPWILNATGELEQNPGEIQKFLLGEMTSRLQFLRTSANIPQGVQLREICLPLEKAVVTPFIKSVQSVKRNHNLAYYRRRHMILSTQST